MNTTLPRSRAAALALILSTALLCAALPGCRSTERKESAFRKTLHSYMVTVKEAGHHPEKHKDPRMQSPEFGFDVEVRHFKIRATAKRIKQIQKKLRKAKKLPPQLDVAGKNVEFVYSETLPVTVEGTDNPSSAAIATASDRSVLLYKGKKSGSRPDTGRIIREGYYMWAEIHSYNDDTGRGKISADCVIAEDGWVQKRLTLEEKPFAVGEPIYLGTGVSPEKSRETKRDVPAGRKGTGL